MSDGIKEHEFHFALVGVLMVAALAPGLDGLPALAVWVSTSGTGEPRNTQLAGTSVTVRGHALR